MNENKFSRILRKLSLGKYQTKLYYGDKNGEYSTITGGIITLSFAIVLIATSLNILIQTFSRDSYSMTYEYADLLSTNLIQTLKMSDFSSTLLNFKYVIP
jgi:hypothetical protein